MSPPDVQEHGSIDPMAVPGFPSEKHRSIVLGLHSDKPVVATQAPAARIPLDPAADVAREEGLGAADAEVGSLEEAEATDACSDVGHHGAPIGCRHHDVAAVVEDVGGFAVRGQVTELEIL